MTKRWLFPQFIYFLTGPFRMISVWISATVASVFCAKTEYMVTLAGSTQSPPCASARQFEQKLSPVKMGRWAATPGAKQQNK